MNYAIQKLTTIFLQECKEQNMKIYFKSQKQTE